MVGAVAPVPKKFLGVTISQIPGVAPVDKSGHQKFMLLLILLKYNAGRFGSPLGGVAGGVTPVPQKKILGSISIKTLPFVVLVNKPPADQSRTTSSQLTICGGELKDPVGPVAVPIIK
jgi:hypothetical protein